MARPSARTSLMRAGLAAWDMGSWALATTFMVAERYNFHILTSAERTVIYQYAVVAMLLQLVIGFITKLYRGRHTVGSFDEAVNIAAVTIIIGAGLLGYFYFFAPPGYPRGVTLLVPFGAVVLMTAARFVVRTIFSSINSSTRDKADNVVVYGAGNAGQQLSRLLAYDPDAPYRIVGFVDDDRDKRHLRINGAPVLGTGEDLVRVAERRGAQTVVVAIPTAKRDLMRRVSEATEREGIKVLVMPNTRELINGQVQLNQLHQLDVADLLGRSQIKTDLSEIAGYLSGRVVLVTGAGGSIGSEIARQVHKFGPKELVMLDRDESLLHGVQLSIYKQGLLDTPNMVLCDIRDEAALDKVFAQHRPDVVFHAAALKHLPMLEQYPLEGWKTNVEGSLSLLRMAEKYEVARYVNVSTDKAADATSVLGKTKRIAEELTAFYAQKTGRNYLSVRFGNVLGSRGSMLHTFTSQIEQGGPITVTHPDITRYFMTIPEACELVIQAGAIGEPGDVLVLDMGEPVKILDVAKGLIARSGKDIKIVFTGLRPNEKMHEVLFSGDEASTPTSHPMIEQVQVPALDPATLDGVDGSDPSAMDVLTAQATAEAARVKNLAQAGLVQSGEPLSS